MKDTSNHATFNIWSGTEYNNGIDGFNKVNNGVRLSDNNYGSIGEKSVKIIRTHATLTRTCSVDIDNLTGTSNITVHCDIHTPNNPAVLLLFGTSTLNAVTVPKSTTSTISLTATTTENSIQLIIQLPDQGKCNLTNIKIHH